MLKSKLSEPKTVFFIPLSNPNRVLLDSASAVYGVVNDPIFE